MAHSALDRLQVQLVLAMQRMFERTLRMSYQLVKEKALRQGIKPDKYGYLRVPVTFDGFYAKRSYKGAGSNLLGGTALMFPWTGGLAGLGWRVRACVRCNWARQQQQQQQAKAARAQLLASKRAAFGESCVQSHSMQSVQSAT